MNDVFFPTALVLVIGALVAMAYKAQEAIDGVLCPSCGHRAAQHSYSPVEKGWEFASDLHRCDHRHPEVDEHGWSRLVRCDCTLSQAEVRFNARQVA